MQERTHLKIAISIAIALIVLAVALFFAINSSARTDATDEVLLIPATEPISDELYARLRREVQHKRFPKSKVHSIEQLAFERLKVGDVQMFEFVLLRYQKDELQGSESFWKQSIDYINSGHNQSYHVLVEIDARLKPIEPADIHLKQLLQTGEQVLLAAAYMALSDSLDENAAMYADIVINRSDLGDRIKELYGNWK